MYKLVNVTLKSKADRVFLASALIFAVIFILSFFYDSQLMSFLVLVTQSAFIGSVADWFAVTALFRNPLENLWLLRHIKISHVALIPQQKEKIATEMETFIQDELITEERLQTLLQRVALLKTAEQFLFEGGEERAGERRLSLWVKEVVDEKRIEWREKGIELMRRYILKLPFYSLVKDLTANFLKSTSGEKLFDEILARLEKLVHKEDTLIQIKNVLENIVATHSQSTMSRIGLQLLKAANIVNVDDMAKVIQGELLQIIAQWSERNYEGRKELLAAWAERFEEEYDDEMKTNVVHFYRELVKVIPVEKFWDTSLWPRVYEVIELNAEGVSQGGIFLQQELYAVWQDIKNDKALSFEIEEVLRDTVRILIRNHYHLFGKTAKSVLLNYETEELHRFILAKVGDELDGIRITGALIGALAGALVWLFLTLLYEPYIAPWIYNNI